MKNNETARWLLIAVLALVATQAFAAYRATPEFEQGATRPVSIGLIPVHAAVIKAKVVQAENLVEESTELGDMLGAELAALLEEQGYEVKLIDSGQVNADPQLQEYVIDANRRYDELSGQIRRNRIKRRIYNGGDEVKLLADYLGVDAIAFGRLQVVAATGGRKAVGLLLGIGTIGGTSASLSLIDGGSGDLEALLVSTYVGASYNSIEEHPEAEMAQIAASILAKLPPADPAARIETRSDEEVLGEIESLLK